MQVSAMQVMPEHDQVLATERAPGEGQPDLEVLVPPFALDVHAQAVNRQDVCLIDRDAHAVPHLQVNRKAGMHESKSDRNIIRAWMRPLPAHHPRART